MKKILVIDDEEIMRLLLEKKLSKAGYRVFLAASGMQGLQMAQEQKPDLILLDINMPGMGGGETAERLRSDSRTKGTPIIFITILLKEEEVKDGFVEGSRIVNQHFLSKPLHEEELFRLVHEAIGAP